MAQAQDLIAAIQDSGYSYGIYSSPGVSHYRIIIILFHDRKLTIKSGME